MLSHDSSDDEDAGDQDSSESEGPIYSPLSDISGRIWSDESPAGMSYGDAEEDFTIEDFLSENEDESHLQGDSEVPVTPQRGNPATLQDPATPQRGDHAAPQRGDATTPQCSTPQQGDLISPPPVDHATSQPGETSTAIQTTCYCYKIVGDNVDKNVKPSLQRHEMKGQSLHHFHCYGVKDRVPASRLSDLKPVDCTPDPTKLLPSLEDVECVKKEMSVLLSR